MKAANSISIVEMFSEIAVALHENRDALSGSHGIEWGHGRKMSAMFAAVETALAELEPAEWSPGRYFDLAAETLLKMDGVEPHLYAAAFRRAGSALLRKRKLSAEEFGLAFAAMASGFSVHAQKEPEGRMIADVWVRAAEAYRDAESRRLPLSACLQAASAAAEEVALDATGSRMLATSSSLVVRAIRDALE